MHRDALTFDRPRCSCGKERSHCVTRCVLSSLHALQTHGAGAEAHADSWALSSARQEPPPRGLVILVDQIGAACEARTALGCERSLTRCASWTACTPSLAAAAAASWLCGRREKTKEQPAAYASCWPAQTGASCRSAFRGSGAPGAGTVQLEACSVAAQACVVVRRCCCSPSRRGFWRSLLSAAQPAGSCRPRAARARWGRPNASCRAGSRPPGRRLAA
jgi:hypothetical protein